MSSKINIKKEASYNFFGSLSSQILSVPLGIFLVHYFSQNDYGLYKQIIFIALIAISLLQLNFHNSLFYFYHVQNSKSEKSTYINQTYNIMIFIGLIFLLLALYFESALTNLFSFQQQEYYLPLVLLITIGIIEGPIDKLFVLENRAKWSFYYNITHQIIRSSVIFITVIYYGTLTTLIWSLIFVKILNTIFSFIYLIIRHQFRFIFINKSLIRL